MKYLMVLERDCWGIKWSCNADCCSGVVMKGPVMGVWYPLLAFKRAMILGAVVFIKHLSSCLHKGHVYM